MKLSFFHSLLFRNLKNSNCWINVECHQQLSLCPKSDYMPAVVCFKRASFASLPFYSPSQGDLVRRALSIVIAENKSYNLLFALWSCVKR